MAVRRLVRAQPAARRCRDPLQRKQDQDKAYARSDAINDLKRHHEHQQFPLYKIIFEDKVTEYFVYDV